MRYKGIETICFIPQGSKTPPQISAEAKKLGGGLTARKSPIGEG